MGVHVCGAINNQGRDMKLRAITLAAAGLLAAASAQAELQTWRFIDVHGLGGQPAGSHIDVTFDLAATLGTGVDTFNDPPVSSFEAWTGPIVSWTFKDVTYTPAENNWIPAIEETQTLWNTRATLPGASGDMFFDAYDIGNLFHNSTENLAIGLQGLSLGIREAEEEMVRSGEIFVNGSQPVMTLRANSGGALVSTTLIISDMQKVPAVPEPSSWALALLGGMGAAALARRRQPTRQAETPAA